MRERALKAKHMESTTRKITLHPDDLVVADGLPIKAISVVPTVNLDEATVVQRFGPPGERLAVSETRCTCSIRKRGWMSWSTAMARNCCNTWRRATFRCSVSH